MKLLEIIQSIEEVAPLSYQEPYDNSGLIIGNPQMEINAALICLDSTEEVLDEAIRLNCNLIIAHHPIVFKGVKKITGKNYIERIIIKAIKNDIAIYAAHTNLDNVWNGVNKKIAEKIGLTNTRILSPKSGLLKKLFTYCPADYANQVRDALFDAGAGKIGEYGECSFNTEGTGTFKGSENTNPFIGEKNKRHWENEIKIETIFPAHQEAKIIAALLKAHPYEEVAYDIISLDNINQNVGSGITGELKEAMTEEQFFKHLKSSMELPCIRHTSWLDNQIKTVSLCGGSGSFLLNAAINSNSDIFITGDFKYHEFFDAEGKIIIADIGHYESERFTSELLLEIIKRKLPTFALHLSKLNTNPINYY